MKPMSDGERELRETLNSHVSEYLEADSFATRIWETRKRAVEFLRDSDLFRAMNTAWVTADRDRATLREYVVSDYKALEQYLSS